jgi:dihydroorotate dehydrogenase electron transfer subunit
VEACCESVRTRPRVLRAPLLRRDSIGPIYHVLTFELDRPLLAEPGQFAMLRGTAWGDSPLLARPMSLLDAEYRPSVLIKVVGEGSRRMAHACPGEPFDLLAPLGKGWSNCPPDVRPILLAGGVGVAPLLFFARTLSAAGVRPLALYGGRTAADLPLDDDLMKAAGVELATEDGSRGVKGRVTELLEPAIAANGGRVKVYACGPEPMMAKAAAICDKLQVPCEVSLETRMACGFGACLGCAVHKNSGGYLHACVEGPCVGADQVRWAQERGDR